MTPIDPAELGAAINGFLASSDARALDWPLRIVILFANGPMLYMRAAVGAAPEVVTSTGAPDACLAPAHGLLVDARGRGLHFLWTQEEISAAANPKVSN